MSLWGWYYREIREANLSGDPERIAMAQTFNKISPLMESNPDEALALIDQAHAMARRRNEAWWMRFFEHWRLQVLLHHKPDYQAALDLAVRAVVEVRKPGYDQFPQRICLHEDLVKAYLGIDPIGHELMIRQALDYIEGEVTPDMQCRSCLQGLRVQFETRLGNLDEALAAAMKELEIDQRNPVWAYAHLCRIAHLRGDWENLAGWASAGEKLADTRAYVLVEFLAWQALCRRRAGDEAAARQCYRRAANRAGRLPGGPGYAYFDAISAYHEIGGDYHLALKVRARQHAYLAGTGLLHSTCVSLIERCRLLRLMGRPLDAALAEARAAIGQLRDPAPLLARLAELTA